MEGRRLLALGIKVIAWLKVPAALALGIVLFTPPQRIPQVNAQIMAMLASHVESQSGRDTERQTDINEANIKSLQQRLDTLEAIHIDAAIASMKATIEYDHALLMTIAGALLLMLAGNVLGYLKKKGVP